MKKMLLIFIVLLINVMFSVAQQEDWFFNSQSLIINVDVLSKASIVPKSENYNVDYVKINLSHFPYESFNQQILSFDSLPNGETEGNTLIFLWEDISGDIDFGYSAKIRTNSNMVKIKEKILFPLKDVPSELSSFLLPQEIIDSDNEEIIKFASKLVEGEDDLFVVVNKLASWTKNNIEYNLSTLTAEVSQKASWALQNRQGVCDELTSLFIAMLRSVGVPAKFISGVAYTNSPLFPENWGSHGWAEVYFPGYGWIPYDVTYGQFGYIDPTHIKLKEALDSNDPSVKYRWLARNVNLETQKLDIDTSLEEFSGRVKKPIVLEIELLKNKVGFGSYNLVEVVLENLEDFYISSEVLISRPSEMGLEGNVIQDILLKPMEKKSAFWIVKTPQLDRNFIYTFPISVNTVRNFSETVNLISSVNEIKFSLDEVKDIISQKTEQNSKKYSKDVNLSCTIDKEEFYSYETSVVRCNIKNIGNVFLEHLDVCLKNSCSNFDLGISQKKGFNFTFENIESGKQQLVVKLKSSQVSKGEYLDVKILDEPLVSISEVEFPLEVSYDDKFDIVFLLDKVSVSNPKNMELILSQDGFENTWIIKELYKNQKFSINILGKDLRKGNNVFTVSAGYEDGNGRKYYVEEFFSVELVNVTIIQNTFLEFNTFLRNIGSLEPKSLIIVGVGSFFVFLLLLRVIFRKK